MVIKSLDFSLNMEGKSKSVVFIICSNSVHPAGKTNKQPKPKVLPSAATGQTADPPEAQLPPSPRSSSTTLEILLRSFLESLCCFLILLDKDLLFLLLF